MDRALKRRGKATNRKSKQNPEWRHPEKQPMVHKAIAKWCVVMDGKLGQILCVYTPVAPTTTTKSTTTATNQPYHDFPTPSFL